MMVDDETMALTNNYCEHFFYLFKMSNNVDLL